MSHNNYLRISLLITLIIFHHERVYMEVLGIMHIFFRSDVMFIVFFFSVSSNNLSLVAFWRNVRTLHKTFLLLFDEEFHYALSLSLTVHGLSLIHI